MGKLKYKIGDVVKITNKLLPLETGLCEELIGRKGRIFKTDNSQIPYKIYLLDYTSDDIENNIDYFYWVGEDNIELFRRNITPKTLEELPIGSIIITSEDECNQYVKINCDEFKNDNYGTIFSRELNDKLEFSETYGNPKLIEIQEPVYYITYDQSHEPVEMTIEEISKELGYDVKIVKSK